MRDPRAFAIGLAIIILLITGAAFLTRNLLINRINKPGVDALSSPSPAGFSSLSPSNGQNLDNQNQTQANITTQPDTGIGDVKNIGIFLESPVAGSTISTPVRVSGLANVYDGLVKIRVKDASGNVLGENSIVACMGTNACPFKTTVTFTRSLASVGTIEAWGLDQNQQSVAQTIPVAFR